MSEENPQALPAQSGSSDLSAPLVTLEKNRPQTSNWRSTPFFFACTGWLLVAVICTLNFFFALVMVSEREYLPALVNCIYGLGVFWIFGSTVIGVPMIFLAVRELERRNFALAELHLNNYVKCIKRLHIYQDGNYTVAQANLALIKLARGDYHHAELLYESLIESVGKKKRLLKHSLNAVYINNLACVKIAQAMSHPELFELELQEAERLANEALQIWHKKDQAGAAYPLQVLAEVAILRDDYEVGEKKIAEVIRLNDAGKHSVYILPEARQGLYFESHLWLTLLYLKQGKKAEADVLCRRLVAELTANPAPVFQHSMAVLNRIADYYLEVADYAGAEPVLDLAYSIARAYPLHPEAQNIALSYELLLSSTGRPAEIADMKAWIRPVLEISQD